MPPKPTPDFQIGPMRVLTMSEMTFFFVTNQPIAFADLDQDLDRLLAGNRSGSWKPRFEGIIKSARSLESLRSTRKVIGMLNQVTIQSRAGKSIKPLVEIAFRNQLKSLEHGIKRTKEKLALFETRFGMSTVEMERRLKSGSLEETLDTIDWCMELEALRLLEEQYNALREARID